MDGIKQHLFVAYYIPADKGWFFITMKNSKPVWEGPYITQAKAQEDADKCRSKAVAVQH